MLHKTLAIIDKDRLDQLLEVEKIGDTDLIERYRSGLIDALIYQDMPRLQDTYDAIQQNGIKMDLSSLELKLKTLHELEQTLKT